MLENEDRLVRVIKLAAQILLENGGETYRVEEVVKFICRSAGAEEIDSVATPTGVYITVSPDGVTHTTLVKRIKKRTIDLVKINEVNTISRQLTEGKMTLEEAYERLEALQRGVGVTGRFSLFYGGISAAFFTLLFGGGWLEFIISLVSGVLVTLTARRFERLDSYQFFSSVAGGFLIAFFAVAGTYLAGFGEFDKVIVGGMMPQLPGLSMSNAIRDTIRGDLVSGIVRGAEALLIAMSLAVGVGVVLSAAYALGIYTF